MQSEKRTHLFEKKTSSDDITWTEFSRIKQSSVTPEDAEASLEAIRKYLSNYVPILLNVIGTSPPHHSQPLHSLLSSFLSIAPKGQLGKFYQSAVEKLKAIAAGPSADEKATATTLCSLLNICVDFVPLICGEKAYIPDLVMTIRPFMLQTKQNGLQKRAYKVSSEDRSFELFC